VGRAQCDLTGSAPDAKSGLPPSRLEELTPRLEALLADFAHLEALESLELEPLPAFIVPLQDDDGGD
jgi:hypothetical protein